MQARTRTPAMKRSTVSNGLDGGPPAGVAIVFLTMHKARQPVQYAAVDPVARHAAAQPDKPAAIDGERRLSWREYHELRNRLVHSLARLRLAAGEHAVLYAHNPADVPLAGAAVRARGAVPGPLNHPPTPEGAAYILHNSPPAGPVAGG